MYKTTELILKHNKQHEISKLNYYYQKLDFIKLGLLSLKAVLISNFKKFKFKEYRCEIEYECRKNGKIVMS